jgi:cardiolipin hydrolase
MELSGSVTAVTRHREPGKANDMDMRKFEELLDETLLDGKLIRKESDILREFFAQEAPTDHERTVMRSHVFKRAHGALGQHEPADVLKWVDETLKTLGRASREPLPKVEVMFAPNPKVHTEVLDRINHACRTIEVCVFNITDREYSDALLAARERGVAIRIITDDDRTSEAKGNKSVYLSERGIPVKIDSPVQQMHNKFAIFDREWLMLGSINWTKAGWSENHENLVLTDDPRLVTPHLEEFEKMWKEFEDLT